MAAGIKEESLVMQTLISYGIVYLHNCDSVFFIRYELLL